MGITNRDSRRVRTAVQLAFGGVDHDLLYGEAHTLDLSLSGCRAICQSPPPVGTKLQVSLYLPGMECSISIERAVVRWARNGRIGIQFCSMPARHREQLRYWILQAPYGRSLDVREACLMAS